MFVTRPLRVVVAFPLALVFSAPVSADPLMPSGPAPSLPARMGKPAKANPVSGVVPAPQQPFMAPNPHNNVHNDAWMTDNYTQLSGPLGRSPRVFSTAVGRICVTLTFDSRGRIVATCFSETGPALFMFDPRTLSQLAVLPLPNVAPPAGTSSGTNTTGGIYFYIDNHDRAVVPASNRHILVIAETRNGGRPGFRQAADYDPTPCLPPDERIPSVLPDDRGRLWFVGRTHGTVGVLDPRTGRCRSIVLGEEIQNSFATAKDGAYIVTDTAQYKFRAGADLTPHVVWRATYRNDGVQKVGQFNAGSGTTPTLAWGTDANTRSKAPDYVAIADNSDPLDVVVYRAADTLERGQKRIVCQVPIFRKGASSDENSLISMGQSLIAENNYGYDPQRWNAGSADLVSEPGMARIDIDREGNGCRKVWTNTSVRPPSAVSKGDTANGLIYTYKNLRDPSGADPWYWTAVDYRSGKIVWRQRAGYGRSFDNLYAGIALARAPGGKPTLYLGGVSGIRALQDR